MKQELQLCNMHTGCHHNQFTDYKSFYKTLYFASVQVINQQPHNRLLINIFSYCRFGVWGKQTFCLGGAAPWPLLVAALTNIHNYLCLLLIIVAAKVRIYLKNLHTKQQYFTRCSQNITKNKNLNRESCKA